MKNKNLLWLLAILLAIAIGIVIGTQIKTNPSDASVFKDVENGVSFHYPQHWETREVDGHTLFAVNFDYLDGLTESSTSTEKEGTLTYSVSRSAPTTIKELQQISDEDYQDCLAMLENAQQELGPFCLQTDYSEWTETTVDGYTALSLDWRGYPESGEIVKRLIVLVDDKELLVNILAVKTGVTDEELIEQAWQQVLDTVKIK